MLKKTFFNRDAQIVAKDLLGKVLMAKYDNQWLSAIIIEAEAYYKSEKGSHASLGFTEKRRALFMPPGTLYLYYSRGADSLNISANGEGNAVLIKSAYPYPLAKSTKNMIEIMKRLNPKKNSSEMRPVSNLCAGQTLLCRSLGITVPEWDQKNFSSDLFYIEDIGYRPKSIIQTTRLGIHKDRDAHLPYRFIDHKYIKFCTKNPLTIRGAKKGKNYCIIPSS